MRFQRRLVACALAAALLGAGLARADDGDVKAEIDALKRQLKEQERKIRELEGKGLTQDEIQTAVSRYLGDNPGAVMVGGAEGGKAGWPKGKKPFIQEGPNRLEIYLRNQIRYEWFHYSHDAKGLLSTPPNTLSPDAPRDRSGFELERLYFGLQGQVFCEDVTFHLQLNFDSDSASGLEKNAAWVDWKYSGDHHVRAGSDKVAFTYEDQVSTAEFAFCDRNIVNKAFAQDWDTGVALWGYLGGCDAPHRFLYRVMASTGEGRADQAGSVFGTDAFDTYSDQPLFSGLFEWNVTGKDWSYGEVDMRACEDRAHLCASVGVSGYYEDDDDSQHKAIGLVLRNPADRIDRVGYNAWLRAQWNGWSFQAEFTGRHVDYTRQADGSKETAPDQDDYGLSATLHYRFPGSPWGVGARAGVLWLDDDYRTVTVGATSVRIADRIQEYGLALNYYFWDHNNKLTADVSWIRDNSGVSSSSAGYMVGASKGVLVEDGVMMRVQWQLNF